MDTVCSSEEPMYLKKKRSEIRLSNTLKRTEYSYDVIILMTTECFSKLLNMLFGGSKGNKKKF